MPNTDETERTETPNLHLPPSSPTSPLPKRIKTDSNANMSAEPTPTPAAATLPVPVPAPVPTASTLPSVSSLLTESNNTAPLPAVPLPAPTLPTSAPPLLVQKLSPTATAPTRGSAFAAGYDLYSSEEIVVKAKNKALVSTSIAIAVPAGTYGRVAPRSGLASKHFLDTGAGVIDADYRGEVKVLMFNFSENDYEVKQGERIAQLVLERIVTPDVMVVETLEKSVRGAGGFGSTGYA